MSTALAFAALAVAMALVLAPYASHVSTRLAASGAPGIDPTITGSIRKNSTYIISHSVLDDEAIKRCAAADGRVSNENC